MAHLRQVSTGEERELCARMTLGRSRRCQLRMPHPGTSARHAMVWWDATGWWLRDLESRNGTRVDGRLLEPGLPVPLAPGALVQLGHPMNTWQLEAAGPPPPAAWCEEARALVLGRGGFLLLPSPREATLGVFTCGAGAWCLERGGEVLQVVDGSVVQATGLSWELMLPLGGDPGLGPDLRELTLVFEESADGEHVGMDLRFDDGRRAGVGRGGHYRAPLALARHRRAHGGWMEVGELARTLGWSPTGVWGALLRSRLELASCGVRRAPELVEHQEGRLRLGTRRVEIRPLVG